jgi:hypothetical protein
MLMRWELDRVRDRSLVAAEQDLHGIVRHTSLTTGTALFTV